MSNPATPKKLTEAEVFRKQRDLLASLCRRALEYVSGDHSGALVGYELLVDLTSVLAAYDTCVAREKAASKPKRQRKRSGAAGK